MDGIPNTHEEIQKNMENLIPLLQKYWKKVSYEKIPLEKNTMNEEASLFIQYIRCGGENERSLILMTGLHGIEGFVGSVMIEYFVKTILDQLYRDYERKDSIDNNSDENHGSVFDFNLHIIAGANPWGQKNKRRVNENNVDLNRNFMNDPENFLTNKNNSYFLLDPKINSSGTVKSFGFESEMVLLRILGLVLKQGIKKFENILLKGQQINRKGLYYQGKEYQPATENLIKLFNPFFENSSHTVFLDLHTGFGPRYEMSLVNSSFESLSSEQMKREFNYPRIVKTSSGDFYQIDGDMIDYLYRKWKIMNNGSSFYGTTMEFGTFGDNVSGLLRSLIAVCLENQAFFHGSRTGKIQEKVRSFFEKAYFPKETKWWNKAINDFDKACIGILKYYKFI